MNCCFYSEYREPLTERHVQALWYDAEMRPARLETRRGEPIEVISPGEWNPGAGPDFTHAVLEVGVEHVRLEGDVEVHLSPGDWDRHGHGLDPLYRKVIAHITWGCGPEPSSLPIGAVSIWFGRYFTSNPSFSPSQVDLSAYPFARLPLSSRPCQNELKENPEEAASLLVAAGSYRLKCKARRLRTQLALRPRQRRQIFYEELMSALGYKQNKEGFRHVAEAVPISVVESERNVAAEAYLVAADFYEWHLGSCRPNNQPKRRLRNAAAVFTRTDIMRLIDARDFSVKGCQRMMRMMRAGGFLGKGRAAALLSNIIVPFALATGALTDVPHWLPPEDVSNPVRLTAQRLFGRDHNPSEVYAANNLLLQGLIQLHRDFCLQTHPACHECGLVRMICSR